MSEGLVEEIEEFNESRTIVLRFPVLDFFGNVHIGEKRSVVPAVSLQTNEPPSVNSKNVPTRKRARETQEGTDERSRPTTEEAAMGESTSYAFEPNSCFKFVGDSLFTDRPVLQAWMGSQTAPVTFVGSWAPTSQFSNAAATGCNKVVVQLSQETAGCDSSTQTSLLRPASVLAHPDGGFTEDDALFSSSLRGKKILPTHIGTDANAGMVNPRKWFRGVVGVTAVAAASGDCRWVYKKVLMPDGILEMQRLP